MYFKQTIISAIAIFSFIFSIGQSINVATGKTDTSLIRKLGGTRYVLWPISKDQMDIIKSNNNNLQIANAYVSYLKDDLKFQDVGVTEDQIRELAKAVKKSCDIVYTEFEMGLFKSTFGALGVIRGSKLHFRFCDNSYYIVNLPDIEVSGLTVWESKLKSTLRKLKNIKREYDANKRIQLSFGRIIISEDNLVSYLQNKRFKYEGIFESLGVDKNSAKIKIGIINISDSIYAVYLGGAFNEEDWLKGEVKAFIRETKSDKVFLTEWIYADKSRRKGESIIFDDENTFTIKGENYEDRFIRTL